MSLKENIGDVYHKNVYRHISRVNGKISDMTDFAITDMVLPFTQIIFELSVVSIVWGVSDTVQNVMNSSSVEEVSGKIGSQFFAVLYSMSLVGGTAMVTYFLNNLRAPLYEQLKIAEKELEADKDIQYTVRKLNELSHSMELTLSQVNDRVNVALDDFVEKVNGYKIEHAQKTKYSMFSSMMYRGGVRGLMNPLFPEIILMTDMYPEDIAHEKSHLVGYPREIDAQLLGFLCMKESGDESLEYLAYLFRLDAHMRCNKYWFQEENKEINVDKLMEKLRSYDLNERTLEEIRTRVQYEQDLRGNLSKYETVKAHILNFFRSHMLSLLGQGDIDDAYFHRPLALIHSIDPPQESDKGPHNQS